MSGILLRNALIDSIKTLLADPVVFPDTEFGIQVHERSIVMHGGALTEADRARYMANLPAVFVGITGTSPVDYIEDQENGGTISPRFSVAVVVVARDVVAPADGPTEGVRFHRSDVAQVIAEKIANDVMFNRPDESTTDISRFRMENAWNTESDRNGIGMWGLVWEQGAEIEPQDVDDLPDFILCETTYAMGGDATPDVVGRATVNPDGVDTEAP